MRTLPVRPAGRDRVQPGGPTAEPTLRIQTLGGLRAFHGDEPLSLPPSRQSRALLAYLACASRPLHRAGLCDLLWENAPEPRAALRWCLSRLRPVLDAGGITRLLADGDTLLIAPAACEVDGKRLRDLAVAAVEASTSDLEDAVARLAGSFLADLELPDAMRFESWRLAEEKSLAGARGALFGELLRRRRDDPEAAVRLGHLWVQQDPFEARPHAAIIEALAALGRKREALAHYERCARMLRSHGGGVPASLEKARAAVGPVGLPVAAPEPFPGRASPQPAAGGIPDRPPGSAPVTPGESAAVAAAAVPAPPRTPLSGRGSEMRGLLALADAAAGRPDGRLHLLSGEPGIGKTRLLEELGDTLASRGWIRLRGRSFEAERGRAFGPWIDAAWALAAERPETAAGCPLLHPGALPSASPGDPDALFGAVREWLRTLSASAPTALLLDDLHWLDPASTALLQFLLRGEAPPFRLLVAGIRSVAANPDGAQEAFLRLARREGWAETRDIGPLDAEGTAALVRQAGSRRDPAEVFALGAGHPLASLALAADGGEGGDGSRGRRESLDAMLDERIRMAGEEGRAVLQWAALLGRGLPPALLESLTDLSVHALLSALERLEAEGLVKVEEGKAGQEYLFGHDLIRQRVREGLSAPRRRVMHAHVAQVLKRRPALSRGAEEVAHHAESGGDFRLAAEALVEAGHQCARLKAYETTAALAMRALGMTRRVEGAWVLKQETCYLVNAVINCLSRFPEGMDSELLRLVAEARSAGKEETVVAGLTALTTLRFEQGRPADVLAAVREVADSLGEAVEPHLRAFTLADMAMCLLVTDQDLPQARRLHGQAKAVIGEYGLKVAFSGAVEGFLLARDGRPAEARTALEAALPLILKATYPGVLHFALADLARLELDQGHAEAALAHAARMRELEPEVRQKADAHFPDALDALALRLLGDPAADAKYLDVLARLRARDTKVMTAYLLLFWSQRDLEEGRLEGVEAACREAIDRCEPLGRVTEPAWARCLLGLLAVRRGRRAEAEALRAEIARAFARPTPPPARIAALARSLDAALAA